MCDSYFRTLIIFKRMARKSVVEDSEGCTVNNKSICETLDGLKNKIRSAAKICVIVRAWRKAASGWRYRSNTTKKFPANRGKEN